MARQPIQRFIGHLMYKKGLTRDAAVLRASIARKNGWIPEKFTHTVSRKAEKVVDTPKVDPQPVQLDLFSSHLEKNGMHKLRELGFIKIAETPTINQERTEGLDRVLNTKRKTVYKRGDNSPDKKKIVKQIANQVTVNPDKTTNILADWVNSTVTADTTSRRGGIKEVRHGLKRHSYILPSLEVEATRSNQFGITNRYGSDVRHDRNPILPSGQYMFQPEGLNKKELIKENSYKYAEDVKKEDKPSFDKVREAWEKLKKERPFLGKKWKSTKEKETYIKKKIRDDEPVVAQTNKGV
ncbi:hypothetical protein H8D85_01525 [bacterium]|nr:hypothetical protein [bacterium]